MSGSWCSRGWKFPNPRFKAYLLIGPEKAAARHGRFIMWHSSPDLCGINRPKPTILTVRLVLLYRAQDLFHHNGKLCRMETQGGRGELGSGERRGLWEMTLRPLKGPAQPSLGPRAWRRPHLSRVTVLPQPRPPHPKLGISALTPRSSPTVHTKQDGKWKVFYGV